MSKIINADAFSKCSFIWDGKTYSFRSMPVGDYLNYYLGDVVQRMDALDSEPGTPVEDGATIAQMQIDARNRSNSVVVGRIGIYKEVILKYVKEMTSETFDALPAGVLLDLFLLVVNGNPDEVSAKN